ncbi:MAG TPA: hypothetical protein PLG25_04430 [bacterium]|nr:hypothetical protein [bacterium]HNE83093.1 hypothetical protein [bacterium]HNM13594.1 hypothetical protein [bacterium]
MVFEFEAGAGHTKSNGSFSDMKIYSLRYDGRIKSFSPFHALSYLDFSYRHKNDDGFRTDIKQAIIGASIHLVETKVLIVASDISFSKSFADYGTAKQIALASVRLF